MSSGDNDRTSQSRLPGLANGIESEEMRNSIIQGLADMADVHEETAKAWMWVDVQSLAMLDEPDVRLEPKPPTK